MKHTRTLTLVTTLGLFASGAVLVSGTAAAAGPETQKAAPKPPDKDASKKDPAKAVALGPPSRAVTNEILDAVAEEMNRALTQLEIPGASRPYHIAYKITEVEVNNCAASLGFTTSKRNQHFVNLEARVRVGTPAFELRDDE